MTFSEKFCAQRRIAPEQFGEVVFLLALRPPARVARPLLALLPNYFAADHELIRSVGRLTRLADFESEALDFLYDPNNRGFLRRGLNLRVSLRRLRSLMRSTLHDVPLNSRSVRAGTGD